MAQPLMLTHAAVPPAQAEALYDAALENNTEWNKPPSVHTASPAWPGEDWDDPSPLPSPLPRPLPPEGSGH